jgi:hypothetical protein
MVVTQAETKHVDSAGINRTKERGARQDPWSSAYLPHDLVKETLVFALVDFS